MYTIYVDRGGNLPQLRNGPYIPSKMPESHRDFWVEYSEDGTPVRWKLAENSRKPPQSVVPGGHEYHVWDYYRQRYVDCDQSKL